MALYIFSFFLCFMCCHLHCVWCHLLTVLSIFVNFFFSRFYYYLKINFIFLYDIYILVSYVAYMLPFGVMKNNRDLIIKWIIDLRSKNPLVTTVANKRRTTKRQNTRHKKKQQKHSGPDTRIRQETPTLAVIDLRASKFIRQNNNMTILIGPTRC